MERQFDFNCVAVKLATIVFTTHHISPRPTFRVWPVIIIFFFFTHTPHTLRKYKTHTCCLKKKNTFAKKFLSPAVCSSEKCENSQWNSKIHLQNSFHTDTQIQQPHKHLLHQEAYTPHQSWPDGRHRYRRRDPPNDDKSKMESIVLWKIAIKSRKCVRRFVPSVLYPPIAVLPISARVF